MSRAIRTLRYDSWTGFKSEFVSDLFDSAWFRPGVFIFRGQADAEWSLVSSFDRWFASLKLTVDRIRLSTQLLARFVEECVGCEDGVTLPNDSDSSEVLALAQHYGLPTRLLDWTASPYIAAYFAFSAHLENVSEAPEYIAIWALKLDSPIWNRESGVEVVQAPRVGNLRLRNQRGLFTIARTPHPTLEDYAKSFGAQEPSLLRFVVRSSEAAPALADLAAMGITAKQLFPGLDGAAKSAKSNVLLEAFAKQCRT